MPILSRFLLVIVAGFAVALAAPGTATAHPPTPGSPLTLTGGPGKEVYAPGERIQLNLAVVNATGAACRLSELPDGALTITALQRDGVPVRPSLGIASYQDGLRSDTLAHLRPTEATQRVELPIASGAYGISSVAYSPTERNVRSTYPVDAPGEYIISLSYAAPNVADLPADTCRGASNTLQLCFRVAAGQHAMSGVHPALFLLFLPLALFSRRVRTAARRSAPAMLCIGLVGGTVLVTGSGTADATIKPYPGSTDRFISNFNTCISRIIAGGSTIDSEGILAYLADSAFQINVIEKAIGHGSAPAKNPANAINRVGTDTEIEWNPDDTTPLSGGVMPDMCSSLMHELTHAYDHRRGEADYGACTPGAKVSTAEARATAAQNRYRQFYKLPLRPTYEGHPLPNPASCVKRPPERRTPPSNPPYEEGDCLDKACASNNGDPHLTTFDGLHYDFQAVGEFDNVQSTVDSLRIQTRQTAFPGETDVSVNSAVAMNVAGDRVGVYAENGGVAARVNGAPAGQIPGSTALPGGGTLLRGDDEQGPAFKVSWPDGSTAWVSSVGRWGVKLDTLLADSRRGTVTGTLGNFDGDKNNDLRSRQGAPIPAPPAFGDLYPGFADSWRISQTESLFDYAPGQSTATFTDRTLPRKPAAIDDRAAAEAICLQSGITRQPFLDNCVLDVAFTGQADFVESAARSEGAASAPPPAEPGVLRDLSSVTFSGEGAGQESWRLDIGEATVIRLINFQGWEQVNVRVEGPDPTSAPGFMPTDPDTYRVAPGGQSRLVISHEQSATYSFQLVTMKDRRLDAAPGQTVRGRLDVPGRADLHVFTAPGNVPVRLADGFPCDLDITVGVAEDGPQPRVYTPHLPCWDFKIRDLEAGERYIVAVWSSAGTGTGEYGFRIVTDDGP